MVKIRILIELNDVAHIEDDQFQVRDVDPMEVAAGICALSAPADYTGVVLAAEWVDEGGQDPPTGRLSNGPPTARFR